MPGYRGKRTLDLFIALPALVLSAPVQIVAAAAVGLKLGRPVLFRQNRPGLDGTLFELMKFRTMLAVDHSKGLTENRDRHTPFGRALRSTSFDELPSLLNVVKGDMSLVGPRPLLPKYLELYSAEQARRHEVKPGLTGLAQVRGRNELSWEARFELDVYYADNCSLLLDLRILGETVVKVVRRQGVSPRDSDVMHAFEGTTSERAVT